MLFSTRAAEAGRKSRTNDLWSCSPDTSFLTSPVVDSHGPRGPPLQTTLGLWCMLPVFSAVRISKTTGPRRGMRWCRPRRGLVNYCRALFFEEDWKRKTRGMSRVDPEIWQSPENRSAPEGSKQEIRVIVCTILNASTSTAPFFSLKLWLSQVVGKLI